jgi:galactose mutarotase-like enzyme
VTLQPLLREPVAAGHRIEHIEYAGRPAIVLRSEADDLEAVLLPAVGLVVASLRHRGDELLGRTDELDAYVSDGAPMGVPLLHPWANRLNGDVYTAAGRRVRLPAGSPLVRRDEHGLPIHGLLTASPHWTVTRVEAGHDAARLAATLDFGARAELLAAFPFPHRITVEARLAGPALVIRTAVVPTGRRVVPVAFGFHPYLRLPGVPRADWRIGLPAARHLALDARGIPTGAWTPAPAEYGRLGARTFDDGYAGLGPGATYTLAGGGRRIAVRLERGYPAAQLFAPAAEDVVCFEPMTAPANALRSGGGLRWAPPGGAYSATFTIGVADEREP